MFERLTHRLEETWSKVRGLKLTEKNIADTLEEVRHALIEADVALEVVDKTLNLIKEKAIGQTKITSLTPAHTLLKIIYDEFVAILGAEQVGLKLTQTPSVIMVAGLQGSGKTTTVAKLAHYLVEREKKAVLVVSVDIYRPGAIEQLKAVVKDTGIQFFEANSSQSPITIAKEALAYAKSHFVDVILVDTAGRLHIDEPMMDEIKALHRVLQPEETLYVIDCMIGQDATRTAVAFDDALRLTGVILTKMDGDARGGAALSIRDLVQKPIKFIGAGEKIEDLEIFYPERIASRILGQGDLMTLKEEAERHLKPQEMEKIAGKIKKGQFDLNDFRNQIRPLIAGGGIGNMLKMLPGMSQFSQMVNQQSKDKNLIRMLAVMDSMTPRERSYLELLLPPQNMRLPKPMKNASSRIKRIALGSGIDPLEVKRLLKQFKQMQEMMKKMPQGGSASMMQQMAGRFGGQMPFGGLENLLKEK